MPRPGDRAPEQLRALTFEFDVQRAPLASVLVSLGHTRVLCACSVEEQVPRWMKAQNVPGGWVTAEYAMLPGSTNTRKQRAGNRPDGRAMEIQRLIGRSLRATTPLKELGERTFTLDCDVLDADGSTRCASITGAAVALQLGLRRLFLSGRMRQLPTVDLVAAVSVGMVDGEARLDLEYTEDVAAAVDMNVVMTAGERLVELQGTGEEATFSRAESDRLLDLATAGIHQLVAAQREALGGRD